MLKISIPTPCYQDWDAMIPNTQGRLCNSCAKTVVDFTNMSDEEVKYFFINKKEECVCGRFRNTQLQRITIELPQNIFHIQMPFWKQFLVASLLVFSSTLFSCDTTTKGDVIENTNTSNEYAVKEYNIGKDTLTNAPLPPPPFVCNTIGVIEEPDVKGTTSFIYSVPDQEVTGIIAIADTSIIQPSIKKPLEKMGEIEMKITDSTKIKNPLKADSIDCNTQIYY